MIYGYIRTSTSHQNPERQRKNILKACKDPSIKFEIETYSGKTQDRPKWKALFKKLQPGDTVYFDEISRMSRNAQEGYKEYMELYTRGVDLIFLKEPYCSTIDYRQRLKQAEGAILTVKTGNKASDDMINSMFQLINTFHQSTIKGQIELAFQHGEDELRLLSERTKEGIRLSEQKRLAEIEKNGYSPRNAPGRQKGSVYTTKKQIRTQDAIQRHSIDFGGTLTDQEIITMCQVSRMTYYKYKRELKQREMTRK